MENTFITENIKLYGKDTAISCAYTLHKREEKIQWHKVIIEGTKDMWSSKTSIMVEDNEIFQLLWVLYWINNYFEVKRKSETEAKSIKIWRNEETWDYLIKVDSSVKWKVLIKLDNLNRLILTKICENTLIKEVERVNTIKLTVEDIKAFIRENYATPQRVNNTEEIQKQETTWKKYKISFTNSYNWKDFENYDIITEEQKQEIEKNKTIENIKSIVGEKMKFLNKDNFNSLTYKIICLIK